MSKDKALKAIFVCPAFPQELVLLGKYLEPIGAPRWGGTQKDMLLDNRHERFHCLDPEPPLLEEPLVMDFKIVLGVPPSYLERWVVDQPTSRVAVLEPPYRDSLAQRFAYYFSRVAEP